VILKKYATLPPVMPAEGARSMTSLSPAVEEVLDLRPGDLVRVRSAAEIFDTLDAEGCLDNLPFMPEMVQYCGRTLRVQQRADKTCDGTTALRRMRNTVHLVDARCDGSAHGGCQAKCLTYWKETWLERVDDLDASSDGPELGSREQIFLGDILMPSTLRRASEDESERVYRCQATEIPHASTPLRGWMIDQYARDTRNWKLSKIVRGMVIYVFNSYQNVSRRFLPPGLRFHGGAHYPFVEGRREKPDPSDIELDLQPGDLVRVKSKEEIIATLNTQNRNRGLSFDAEMLPYCGTTARIKSKVNRLIDEQEGTMIQIKRDCYILEGVVCKADFHRFCTRSIYPYWRSVWLDKVE
jgi:hypothetical protein